MTPETDKLTDFSQNLSNTEAAVKMALEIPTRVIIHEREYQAKSPTISALLRVSAIVSKYPRHEVQKSHTPEEVLKHVLMEGAKYEDLGDIVAALVLGWQKYPTPEFMAEYSELSAYVEDNMNPAKFETLVTSLLNNDATARFFAFTAFLSELNLVEEVRQDAPSGG